MRNVILLIICMICLTKAASSREYALVKYSVDNGLSNNTVRCITQDNRGFMWFGTADGINQFDGYKFRTYNSENQLDHKLTNTSIHSMCMDSKNHLWVGTERGIFLYNAQSDSFSHFNNRTQFGVIITGHITRIVENGDGKIWIGTGAQGFFIYRPQDGILEQNSRLSDAITDITKGPDGNVFVSTQNGIIAEYDSEGKLRCSTQNTENRNAGVRTMCYYNDRLWACIEGSLTRMEVSSGSVIKHIQSKQEVSAHIVLPLSRGELLVGADNGLSIFYAEQGKSEPISDISSPYKEYVHKVNALFRDREGGIWVATQYNGVTYLPRRLRQIERMPHNLASGSKTMATCFAHDSNNNLWIAIDNQGVSKVADDGSMQNISLSNISTNGLRELRSVRSLLVDGDNLWIGTLTGGIYAYNTKTGSIQNYRNNPGNSTSLNDNHIEALFKDDNGDIYAGTPWGFAKYNKLSNDFERINRGGNDVYVCDFAQASPGVFWILSRNKTAFLFDVATGVFKHYPRNTAAQCTCIVSDNQGNTWIGTESGLLLLNRETGRFEPFALSDGSLKGIAIASLEEDLENRLWISTNSGLFCLDAERKEIIYHLTLHDGIPSNQFNDRASTFMNNGRLYFGSVSGYVNFIPENLQRNAYVPSICLTGLSLNDKEIEINRGNSDTSPLMQPLHLSKSIKLKYSQNSVGFTFASMSYQAPLKNKYAYKLEGADKEWVLTNLNEAHYANLSPGKYTFFVRGSNDDGIWADKTTKFNFTIRPPFYRSTVAVLLYLLLSGLLGLLSSRYIQYKHRKKLAEFASHQERLNYQSKIDFFTNIAHEIRTPLSLIKVPLESIIRSNESFSPKTKEYLHIMDKNTESLLEMVNQLLDLRKTEEMDYVSVQKEYSVSELTNELCMRFSPMAEVRGITIEPEITPNITARIDNNAVSKILNNLLSNALKYAQERVIITLSSDDTNFYITVSDDGQGVVPQDLERIFDTFYQSANNKGGTGIGLPLARLLAVKHGGAIWCENNPQGGAIFNVEIPLATTSKALLTSQDSNEADHTDNVKLTDSQDDGTHTVLVVEDNDQLRSVIAEILCVKYNVVEAANGKLALDMLAQHNCDIIVSDIMMPEMDGYQLCEYVKSEMRYSHIPIIQLTAKTSLEDKVRGLEHGADAYIEKPFSGDHLMAQIDSLIKNRERIRLALMSSEPIEDPSSLGVNRRDVEFIEKLNANIEDHINEETFYIDQLAEKMYMSRSNFYRKIKSLFGISPNDYMKNYRLKKAAEMIRSGEYMIKEIYEQVGFKTSSYFSACFKEEFGITPKQYKENHTKYIK